MSVQKLRMKMQAFANDPTYNSAVACFVVESGNRITTFAETDTPGEDGITTGATASIATNTILPILQSISGKLQCGLVQKAQLYLEKGFLTLEAVEVDVLIQDRKYVKKCLFAFLYTATGILTSSEHAIHLTHIGHAMEDQTERVENTDGTSTLRQVRGLKFLLKEALEEQYNSHK